MTGIGEIGEIHIRTPYLANGYLNDEALTAQRFIINPFTQWPEDRIYKSGDLARYNPNGEVDFIGRRDLQVNLRGHRVELEEIETVLAEHLLIQPAAIRPGDVARFHGPVRFYFLRLSAIDAKRQDRPERVARLGTGSDWLERRIRGPKKRDRKKDREHLGKDPRRRTRRYG